MDLSDRDGNLWWAQSDTSIFSLHPSPPTNGSVDAVVHHDQAGRLFWSEMNQTLGTPKPMQAAVRINNAWLPTHDFNEGDRPWFATNSTNVTYLAFGNTTGEGWVELWKNQTGVPGWTAVNGSSNPVINDTGLFDFANDTHDRLYLLMSVSDIGIFLGQKSALDDAWTFSLTFNRTNGNHSGGFGIPRLVIDLSDNVYVVYGENRSANYSIWLRMLNANGTWTEPARLGPVGNSAAQPGAIAGSAGRVGVGWYEATGNILPGSAPDGTTWRYMYSVFKDANTTPVLLGNATVTAAAHNGPLQRQLGDFSFAIKRLGNSSGHAALAFSCDAIDLLNVCVNSALPNPPAPYFAVQTQGPGVLI